MPQISQTFTRRKNIFANIWHCAQILPAFERTHARHDVQAGPTYKNEQLALCGLHLALFAILFGNLLAPIRCIRVALLRSGLS